MSLTAHTPENTLLDFEILINGEVTGLNTFLTRLDCKYELNKLPFCKLEFISSNPDRVSENELAESDVLNVNDEIEIKILEEEEQKTLFKGLVFRLERNIDPESGFATKVDCKDASVNLMSQQDVVADENFETKMSRFLREVNVPTEVEMEYGGEEIVSKTSNITPWDYILSYLDVLGYLAIVREGVFKIIDITADAEEPKYLGENGVNVFSFEGTREPSVSNVIVRTWNPGTQEVVTQDNPTDLEDGEGTETVELTQTNYSTETVNQMSRARAAKNRLATFKGKFKTFGNLQAGYGDWLKFAKVNQNIDGENLLISAEHHTFENGCWNTEYSFGLENNQSFQEQITSSTSTSSARMGQSNSVNGLQIGVVTRIDADPQNEFRIKVRIPSISDSGEGVWARLASFQAGSGRGSFFIPHIDDEVVLGCFDNNPDTPVILGVLYSSAHPMPYEINKENYLQGIVSKEGTRIVIDDEKKIVEISTQSNKKLTIGDDVKGFEFKDDNGNEITFNDKGIKLKSSGDIILEAGGNIKIDGIQHTLKASGTMSLEGAIINLN